MKFSPKTNYEHLAALIKQSPKGFVIKSDDELLESLKKLPNDIDLNYVDGDFNTVLYLASANNCIKTVDYLLNIRKVDPNVKVTENLTALHIASTNGFIEIVKLLVNVPGIKILEQDKYGETPLFRAVGNAPDKVLAALINILIAKDKNIVSITNEDQIGAIELALQRQAPAVIKILLENGAKVSAECRDFAANMLLQRSEKSSIFNGAHTFYTGNQSNSTLLECAKLIINAYNDQNLQNDMKQFMKK